MPFIDPDKKFTKPGEVVVETPFVWTLKDKSIGGSLVIRANGGIGVEVHGETANPAEIGPKEAKRFALLLLAKHGIRIEFTP